MTGAATLADVGPPNEVAGRPEVPEQRVALGPENRTSMRLLVIVAIAVGSIMGAGGIALGGWTAERQVTTQSLQAIDSTLSGKASAGDVQKLSASLTSLTDAVASKASAADLKILSDVTVRGDVFAAFASDMNHRFDAVVLTNTQLAGALADSRREQASAAAEARARADRLEEAIRDLSKRP